jgi:tetratricopeptide (TPR) repeat protein
MLLVYAVCVALAALGSAPAWADEGEARDAMQRGVAALGRGDAADALVEFRKAEALVPEAPVPYRYAGEALEQLGRFEEAVASYSTYLSIRPDSKDAAEIRGRIDRINSEKLQGQVAVRCSPDGAEVFVDGAPTAAGVTPLEELHLSKGGHSLTVRAPGHVDKLLPIAITAGATTVVQCELSPIPPPRIEPPVVRPEPRTNPTLEPKPLRLPEPPPPPPGKAWYQRKWVWAAAGAAVVAGGAAIWFAWPRLPDTQGGDIEFP